MMTRDEIYGVGMHKLAAEGGDAIILNPLRVPSPQDTKAMDEYATSGVLGGLGGAATATMLAALLKQKMLPSVATGTGIGALAAMHRQYDKEGDPPGLSPVYTIPAGMRLGALTGGVAGAGLGGLLGGKSKRVSGLLRGALMGVPTGAVGGGLASDMI